MPVKSPPDGYHTVTPYLVVRGAATAIDFLQAAFGATCHYALKRPDGSVLHAELTIGDARLMLADESKEHAPTHAMLYLYVPDVDAAFRRALAAGATVVNEPADQFFGERTGSIKDPAGNQWEIATRMENLAPHELQRRADEMFRAEKA